MKNLITKIQNKTTTLAIGAKTKLINARSTLTNTTGEGYIDTAVKIIIAVVVGALLLGGLYYMFNEVVLPNLETELGGMFSDTPAYTPAP